MASEINLYQKRILTLIQITNELKYFDLSSLLKALGERVFSIGSLNSLGKFEWIDSILIKVSLYIFWIRKIYVIYLFIYNYYYYYFFSV